MFFKEYTLQKRILKEIFGVYVLVALCVTFGQIYIEYLVEKRESKKAITKTLDSIKPPLEKAMWRFDLESIEKVLKEVSKKNHVNTLILKDELDDEIVSLGKTKNFRKQDYYSFPLELKHQKEPIGTLTIFTSKWSFYTDVFHSVILTIGASLLKGIIFITLIYFVIRRLVTFRLGHIQDGINQILENKEAQEVRIEENQQDELSQLLKEFSLMKQEILNRDKELKKKNVELDERVKQRTKELEDALVQLGKNSDAKNRFLSMVGHELRTPLNVVMGMGNILLENNIEDKETIHAILNAGESLLTIINEIIDFTHLQNDEVKLHEETICIKDFLESLSVAQEKLFGEKEITFKLSKDNTLFNLFKFDAARLNKFYFTFWEMLINIVTKSLVLN